MSIQDMEDLKQYYLDEMQSISNQIQIKDYRNERINIRFRRECEIMIDELKGKFNGMSIKINKKKELQQLNTIPLNEIVSQIPPSIAITPVLPTLEPDDSLIMGDENLSTIPEKESDEVIKSSVEDLVPIPRESGDTFGSDSECDLPSCNVFPPINSLSDEDVPEDTVKIYSKHLFEFDDKYISSDVNPLFDEVLENIKNIDVSTDIEDNYHDSEGDIIYLESLLINDTTHNIPPEVFLDHDPRSLKDEPDKDDLKIAPDYEDSRARSFVHRSLDI
ncbi:hypothetical protein Tco_1433276 [Tanacetum coccineum]